MDDYFNKPFNNALEQSISVVIATKKDLEVCKKIRLEAITKNPEAFASSPERYKKESEQTEEEWKEYLMNEKTFTFLAKNNNEAIGMEIAKEKEENIWRIFSLYVRKNFRNKNIGKELFEKIIKEVKKRGGKKVLFNVSKEKEQEVAREMYFKYGSKIVHDSDGYYDMELDLTNK